MKPNDLTNVELVSLSKELKTMSLLDSPSTHKKSELLKSVWDNNYGFADAFSSLRLYITSEIIHRINTDTFLPFN